MIEGTNKFLTTNEEKPFDKSSRLGELSFDGKKRVGGLKDPFEKKEVQTNYPFEEIERALDLPIEQMKEEGVTVLDIGSGSEGRFSQEAKERGIDVISLNPALSTLFNSKERGKHHGKAAAGLVQEMPFKDNSFDFEISYLAIPFYLERHEQEYRDTFSEIIRTLKPGGSARLFPISNILCEDETFGKIISDFTDQAKITLELAPNSRKQYRMIIQKYSEDKE